MAAEVRLSSLAPAPPTSPRQTVKQRAVVVHDRPSKTRPRNAPVYCAALHVDCEVSSACARPARATTAPCVNGHVLVLVLMLAHQHHAQPQLARARCLSLRLQAFTHTFCADIMRMNILEYSALPQGSHQALQSSKLAPRSQCRSSRVYQSS